jgi:hypothetical protein
MKWLTALLALLALPTLAQAQTIDKWTFRVYLAGAAAPQQPPLDLLAANVVCNQAPPTTTSTVNPNKVVFDDIVTVGRVCIWTDPGTGPLFAVPFGGTYEGTLTATNIAGTSAETPRVPFSRPGFAPIVPSGLRLLR